MRAPLHPQESQRLEALRETGALDTSDNPLHNAVVQLAADLCGVPIAAISLIDSDRQYFPAITGLGCRATPRDLAFCAHTILQNVPLVVNDATKDARFADNALVTDAPGIRFYAGVPLKTAENLPIGALCVIDTEPRELTDRQLSSLHTLGGFVAAHLELARRSNQLIAQQSLNTMVIDNAIDYAMITLDVDGLITSWNAGALRLKGFSAQEVIGQPYSCLFSDADVQQRLPETILAQAAAAGRCECIGWRRRKDGSEFHIVGSLSAALDQAGRLKGYVNITRDNTLAWQTAEQLDRRTSELALANDLLTIHTDDLQAQAGKLADARRAADEANRSKSEFLANMSHEIRTPMTAILGFTELLANHDDADADGHKRVEYIDTIKRNGDNLLTIINDILDISKIEAGKMSVESIATDPIQIVRDVVTMVGNKARIKGLDFRVDFLSPVPAEIRSDPVRLRQILMNLLGNAIKFTNKGSVTLTVACDVPSQTLRFRVLDTGIGLTQTQISKLFGAFVQADASTTRKFGGTGMGLLISKCLAGMLGGDITVWSEHGQGSTFEVRIGTGDLSATKIVSVEQSRLALADHTVTAETLAGHTLVSQPVVSQPVASQPVNSQPVNSQPVSQQGLPLAGLRVVLAEDGPDNQRLIIFHIRKAGAEITTVDNGRKLVELLTDDGSLDGELLATPPFDIVLSDMQMPELDGYAAVRLLRTKGCTLPIIALTAHTMTGDREKCLNAGCDAYASKPIDRVRLVEACLSAIKLRPRSGSPARIAA